MAIAPTKNSILDQKQAAVHAQFKARAISVKEMILNALKQTQDEIQHNKLGLSVDEVLESLDKEGADFYDVYAATAQLFVLMSGDPTELPVGIDITKNQDGTIVKTP